MAANEYQRINSLEPVVLLSEPKRLAILQLLMRRRQTLTDLAEILDSYPAQVRHHLKLLEAAGLVKLVDTEARRGFVAKYYRASARAYLIQLPLVPLHDLDRELLLFSSHDLGLELLGKMLQHNQSPTRLLMIPVGSLDALIALRQQVCQLSGCHLLDVETGRYNLPFVQHLFPGQEMQVIHIARRLQGLIVPPGNPLKIREFADIANPQVRFINRQPGSGTRLWLDHKLQAEAIPTDTIHGYDRTARTHHEVAQAVAGGEANLGVGLFAAALAHEAGFIPLFEEAFDLVLPRELAEAPIFTPVGDLLNSAEFRMAVQILGGYYPRRMGEVLHLPR